MSSGDGLIRDFRGNWIDRFITNWGYCTILTAELWASF